MDYIPKDELVFGKTYYCEARNFEYGLWDGEKFVYYRTKFGSVFVDSEYHWDDESYGTVKPLNISEEYIDIDLTTCK